MGHLGFSYVGLIYLLLLFIPNLYWARHLPPGYSAEQEPRVLVALERVGQVAVTCCALIFQDFNVANRGAWTLWLAASALLMLLYEGCWVRYFRRPSLHTFYGNLGPIPVPLASLPVAAFLCLGLYGQVIWMVAGVVVLGIGHIGIHLQHHRALRG